MQESPSISHITSHSEHFPHFSLCGSMGKTIKDNLGCFIGIIVSPVWSNLSLSCLISYLRFVYFLLIYVGLIKIIYWGVLKDITPIKISDLYTAIVSFQSSILRIHSTGYQSKNQKGYWIIFIEIILISHVHSLINFSIFIYVKRLWRKKCQSKKYIP